MMSVRKIVPGLFVAILFLGGGFAFYVYADSVNYWVVTDPEDPRFDPDKFAFNNYRNHTELAEALKVLIHPGMPRKEAEKFLDGSPDKRGGSDVTTDADNILKNINIMQNSNRGIKKVDIAELGKKTKKVIFYGFGGRRKLMNPLFGWRVIAFYDENDKVLQIIAASEVLFN